MKLSPGVHKGIVDYEMHILNVDISTLGSGQFYGQKADPVSGAAEQKEYGRLLPLIIMGSLTLLGACVSFFLPETVHRHLPETVEEGEKFGKGEPHIRWRW